MADPDMRFDLNVKDADIHEVLADFFREAERDFVLDDDLKGVITIHAADLRFRDALQMVLPSEFKVLEIEKVFHIRRMPDTVM